MESRTYLILKYVVIGLLLLISAITWSHSIDRFISERDELVLQFEQIFQTLSLPIRMAQLSLEEEITELPQPVYGVSLSEIGDTYLYRLELLEAKEDLIEIDPWS